MDRWKMLEWVQALCFVVVDMELYLDTHPCDECALEYYCCYQEELECLKVEYEELYGPLMNETNLFDEWAWVTSPWPWEGSEF